ncbi:PdaC/SigV domain-containing protein [Paenibacillus kandeliae]|uniref:PdaC/SigV domain-containing protein n=1 Tax=Paenibacillus kandeliae TaxID=3231269 RepID=UPI0034574C06
MNKFYKLNNTTHLKKLAAIVLASSLAAVGTVAVLPGNATVAQAATTSTTASKSAIHVQVEGKAVATQGMLSKTGKTLVPLKDAAKAFGASVTYDAKTHSVIVKKGKLSATYQVYSGSDDNSVYVSFNGGTVGDNYDGQVVKGVSYVEIKALSEPFGYRALWNNATRTVNLTQAGMNDVTVTPTTLNAKAGNDYTDISIVYPVVSGLDNATAQTAINKALKAHFDQYLAAVQKQAKELGAPTSKNMRYEIDGGYKMTYNQNGVISFLLTDYQYLGGAHGDDVLTGMTFSLKDGKLLKLDDLLKSNTNYRQDLKKLLQADIRKHADDMGVSLEQFNDLSKSSSKYLENFYLTASGFNVFFQKYDIAPGAAGNPEFEFTFSQLLKSGSNPLSSYK